MIKANEWKISDFVASLRYNSIIQDEDKKLFIVSGVDTFNCRVMTTVSDTWYSGDTFYPIKLTEEWLLKFGWLVSKNDIETWYKPQWIINKDADENFYIVKGDKVELQYVHQLQNLVYALTGEELTNKIRSINRMDRRESQT